MAMAAPTAMPTDPSEKLSLLTLAQWLSPAYPIGAFSYSHGLEWQVQSGDVDSAQRFSAWLHQVMQHGSGRNDAILLTAAYRAEDSAALDRIDQLARALAPSSERLQETVLQGAAFGDTTARIWGHPDRALTYPVAIGAAAQAQSLPLKDSLQLYLHGFASNLTAAATRLVPLGQTEAQRVLAEIGPLCVQIADEAGQSSLDDLGSCCFIADIASMKHETQYSRLFRS